MKRGHWILSAFLVMTMMLSGCTDPLSDLDPAANDLQDEMPFTVTLRHTQLGEAKHNRYQLLLDAVSEAESQVPGLTFELDGLDSDVNRKEKLKAEMAVNHPPIIFDLFGGADTQLYASNDRLLELTPILNELGIKDQFINLEEFTVDGGIYGLPIGGFQEGYFYNKKMFQTLELQPPQTMEDLDRIAETVKAAGKIPFAMASKQAWVPLMTANTLWSRYAGYETTQAFVQGTSVWNNPAMEAAFSKYKQWVDLGYFSPNELSLEYSQQYEQLLGGEAAMMFDGSWASSVFVDPAQTGGLLNHIGFFPMPSISGGPLAVNAGFSNGYGFAANLSDRELLAVKAFIRALYNEKMQLRGVLEDNVLPSMKINPEGVEPLLSEIIETGNRAEATFPAFDSIVQPSVNQALSEGIHQLISGQLQPAALLDKIQQVQELANR
jgi:raffinose/stachyose/melibiose transport system substrate-binding protein